MSYLIQTFYAILYLPTYLHTYITYIHAHTHTQNFYIRFHSVYMVPSVGSNKCQYTIIFGGAVNRNNIFLECYFIIIISYPLPTNIYIYIYIYIYN
jgi:hypothetical protein